MAIRMKRDRTYVENRRKSILNLVRENSEVQVEQLASRFGVSPITIRRDLQYLEDKKKLVRFYGGAVLCEAKEEARGQSEIRIYQNLIASYAASLIEDGDTIFLNTSSTALRILQYVTSNNVTVITNNGKVIYADCPENVNIILTGGEIRYPKEALVGDYAIRNLQTVFAKKSFIGCSGISPKSGVTTENANEASINELMLKRVIGRTYILADHRKIGHSSSFTSCDINTVTNVITDEKAPIEVVEALREAGVEVYQVQRDVFN